MAWTAPMTAVANATFTAAQFNANVRDNFLETEAAKATTAGSVMIATGANAIVQRVPTQASVATGEATSSATYTALATPGPAVTVTTGTQAMVWFKAVMKNAATSSSVRSSVAVSGATTVAASDAWCLLFDGATADNYRAGGMFHLFTGLTPGSNTFTMQYKVGGTGSAGNRVISVLPL